MALKRISDNQEFLSTHKIVRVLKNLGDITVRSSLADYCFKITDTLLLTQAKFLDQPNQNPMRSTPLPVELGNAILLLVRI